MKLSIETTAKQDAAIAYLHAQENAEIAKRNAERTERYEKLHAQTVKVRETQAAQNAERTELNKKRPPNDKIELVALTPLPEAPTLEPTKTTADYVSGVINGNLAELCRRHRDAVGEDAKKQAMESLTS